MPRIYALTFWGSHLEGQPSSLTSQHWHLRYPETRGWKNALTEHKVVGSNPFPSNGQSLLPHGDGRRYKLNTDTENRSEENSRLPNTSVTKAKTRRKHQGSVWRKQSVSVRSLIAQSRAGFLNLGATDIWGQVILCCGECPGRCRTCGSIPGRYTLCASSTTPPAPVMTTKRISQHCQTHPRSRSGWGDSPHLSNTDLNGFHHEYRMNYFLSFFKEKTSNNFDFIGYKMISETKDNLWSP